MLLNINKYAKRLPAGIIVFIDSPPADSNVSNRVAMVNINNLKQLFYCMGPYLLLVIKFTAHVKVGNILCFNDSGFLGR